ncbi:LysR family transcriptional regulator [Chitinimonas koreensis]|uniref:LysR family transcriptional regulator n=1 Tax=Chitinimonas koreensis TaxID=356302 RepID=UPI0004151BEA|nr:LysR family transcriptional regulator [Chitinimonas koreensis]QNM97286.1 LysR family transcriptional regulator [Chitinimonas koreensis]
MELYQLRTFVTVAHQGHLTQAAEILHLSQPAVTAQIKALEEETGTSLFERTSSGVTLTEAGKLLVVEAEKILAGSLEMLNRAKALRGEPAGKLRIGTILTPEALRLGPWLALLRQRHPLLQISTLQGISGGVLNEVRKKELDAGFFIGRNPYQTVHMLTLADAPYVVAAPLAWRASLEGADWRVLGRQPWVGATQFSSMSKLHAEIWREHNIAPKKVYDIDQEQTMLVCVEAGLGLCILRREPAEAAAREGRLWIWGDAGGTLPLSFIYPAERADDPLVGLMRQALLEVWPGARLG